MIRVRVIKNFHLAKFNELENIQRASVGKNIEGYLYPDDTFECTEEMVEYLTGKNVNKEAYVEVIEIEPKEETKKTARRRKRSLAKD